ncbi:MAG: glucoamylase family protein [Candidatus Omnitrophica bacterium]|nr:glucoamylase family protein [Candidatus Omnitrophota bacterium]
MISLRRKARILLTANLVKRAGEEEPLRSELCSLEQLQYHAKALARNRGKEVKVMRGKVKLHERLAENEKVLIRTHKLLMEAVYGDRSISPAGEWLLDNFYLIREQIRTIHQHFPKTYSRELPRLIKGPFAGYPRVYEIAYNLISHGDGRVDEESLSVFVASYQNVISLKLGELWAVPIMIRLALVENLRRVALRVEARRRERDIATSWAEKMIVVAEKEPNALILEMADMARSDPPFTPAFVAEFTRRLQGQSSALALPISWLEQRLMEQGKRIERLVHLDSQQQAADQVSISNTINSLRTLGAIDWRDFVTALSVVERTLSADPNGFYASMDFATRDRYRHVVENLARRTGLSEEEVARRAVTLAREKASETGSDDRAAHVGYFLIDKGLPFMQRAVRLRLRLGELVSKLGRKFPLFFYLCTIALFIAAAVITGLSFGYIHGLGVRSMWLLGAVLVLCSSRFAISITNWLMTLMVAPRVLARMDFTRGIPASARTLTVVPTMLRSKQGIDHLIEDLEVRYLANRDDNLFFGLLTDFPDAPSQDMPGDGELLEYITMGIMELNSSHSTGGVDRFFLFHRPRTWNPRQNVWMSYERKRGKLSELNLLLRGKRPANEGMLVVGDISPLQDVKYVITLDTDTHMPLEAARELVATIAHPLNRPVYDEKRGIVSEGYGILQPRVGVSMAGARRSWFARLFSGDPGIDPYTQAVSDVYQDVFGEGSFIGKGLYDVDMFTRTMDGRFPDDLILSHDLLEGCYARSGLVSDIQFFEEYPSSYIVDANRKHRWVRGDWQIIYWLLPMAPCMGGSWIRNPISLLSKWKIFDNLWRSLVPVAMTLLLFIGWVIQDNAVFWTMFVFAMILVPQLAVSAVELFKKPPKAPLGAHLKSQVHSAVKRLVQAVFMITTLPFEAFLNVDAIARALIRMFVTRRKTLEWVTSSDMKRLAHTRFAGFYASMWTGPVLAVVAATCLVHLRPAILVVAAPLLVLWMISPAIAWWLSQIRPPRKIKLRPSQDAFLREAARRTWRYFEQFVNAESNWLPADNHQEEPLKITARRTSPTNMGMALLSNLSAYDFRYISCAGFLERTENTLETMKKLERFRGNFYNWYDTQTLRTLQPLYISSVDSGNLAGALLVLKQGLLGLQTAEAVPDGILKGVENTAFVLASEMKAVEGLPVELGDKLRGIKETCSAPADTFKDIRSALEDIGKLASEISEATWADKSGEVKWWAGALERQCFDWIREIDGLMPWLKLEVPVEIYAGGVYDENELVRNIRSEMEKLDGMRSLTDLARIDVKGIRQVVERANIGTGKKKEIICEWIDGFLSAVEEGATRASERITELERLSLECGELADMEFEFLYDGAYKLLSVGYNVTERRRDPSCYDLLASEARLASFVGIALGRIPQEHWFTLGRLFTTIRGIGPVLLSWSGSMFEYLMPLLFMPTYADTILDHTYRTVVNKQIRYTSRKGVPWGISESGYNATDAHMSYQYRAFGVPDLGFKRGLGDDLVIAPYASMLALMVKPDSACSNLMRLRNEGVMGKYGFYEAVDYTTSRLPHGYQGPMIVRSFMAHHQGMSFLSMAYVLLDKRMQRRFLSDPAFQAAEVLLHERVPKATPFHLHFNEPMGMLLREQISQEAVFRTFNTPHTPVPEVHLLSNGNYNVMITNSGSGYSRWNGLAVTRWQPDVTRDAAGSFCYMKDSYTGEVWSVGYQPALKMPEHYEAIFSRGKAEFRRRDGDIETHMQMAVSPEDDIEIRRMNIVNNSKEKKVIELTSYSEVVMAYPEADAAHPAFSKLFVSTEIIREKQAILCSRRKRSAPDPEPYLFHLAAVHGPQKGNASYETDRAKFVGRGGSLYDAEAMRTSNDLSGTEGPVLDPITSIRCRVVIDPEETVVVDFVTGMADTREKALEFVDKYRDRHLAGRVFDLAWTHAQVVLQQANADETDAQLFGRLANSVVYPSYLRRAGASVIMKNRREQSGLWGYSISGDLPIVLVRISDPANIDLVRQMLKAHIYWRMKGLEVDLVIWNEDHSSYRQDLQNKIMGMVTAGMEAHFLDRPGGVFIRQSEQISEVDKILFQTLARIIISDTMGTLAEQIDRRSRSDLKVPRLIPTRKRPAKREGEEFSPFVELVFFNGLGGFTPDGREYVIFLKPGMVTPAPWANVIANPFFGTVVSERGGAYTWFDNSSQYRLTPWYNDPVSDISGEAMYIRDEEAGNFWSPSPGPARGQTGYAVRHGCGYTVFSHREDGIETELWVYVAIDAAVKYSFLKIKNVSGREKKLSLTSYVEPVLGEARDKTQMHVVTEIDPKTGALFMRNYYNADFGQYTTFLDVSESVKTTTGDRAEFIGRNGDYRSPAAMHRTKLSNRLGAGFDPCGAIQTKLELADGQEKEVAFILGAGRNADEARDLVKRYKGTASARENLNNVWNYWNHMLGAVYVNTPEASMNVMTNSWLLYQTVACRMWARSGYYQSGGAFGFRDQLQDAMALVHSAPYMLREQIVRASGRQFREGDVQHWWHEPYGAGVRTHFSDDLLWLPLAVARYVKATGDTGVLEERTSFLEGRPLDPDTDAYYDRPARTEEKATVYEHCVRALSRAFRYGEHGLPLMGAGDWNDGMNLVGAEGKGESVWLAFFLFYVVKEFGAIARMRGDIHFEEKCRHESDRIAKSIDEKAWDGKWYLRAFFDDGKTLGSHKNEECSIDSIAQSWSVISAAGDKKLAETAMDQVYRKLVHKDAGLIQLLAPPFDTSDMDPGYIKGYLPGIRENGGQYTHAAVWVVIAFILLGDRKKAWELFQMINPVNHGSDAKKMSVYKVEPYVVAADVYASSPHAGRGGWTWYTGSAGWMYRLVVEHILGITLEDCTLAFKPCVPDEWAGYTVHYRFRETVYHIHFKRVGPGGAVSGLTVDGDASGDARVHLIDDHREHEVKVDIGK